jgi:hypothetical protein
LKGVLEKVEDEKRTNAELNTRIEAIESEKRVLEEEGKRALADAQRSHAEKMDTLKGTVEEFERAHWDRVEKSKTLYQRYRSNDLV